MVIAEKNFSKKKEMEQETVSINTTGNKRQCK